jgi:hypothetical protein
MSIMTRIADVDHAISALDGFLRSHDYTGECRRRIADHVREHGTLEGASPRYLDREHYETAEAVFCEALPPVPRCSDDWDIPGYQTPTDARPALSTVPVTADDILPSLDSLPDPTPDQVVTTRPDYWEALERDGITRLPAISGGAPDAEPEPYEPSEADLAELGRWLHGLDSDPMAFPEKADSLADRKRWQHQNNLTDQSFANPAE